MSSTNISFTRVLKTVPLSYGQGGKSFAIYFNKDFTLFKYIKIHIHDRGSL